jgi:hypothetical protein
MLIEEIVKNLSQTIVELENNNAQGSNTVD